MTQPVNIRAEYWAVEVPEDYSMPPKLSAFKGVKLEPGHWQIICTTKDCTEEQAKEIVEEYGTRQSKSVYVDYSKENIWIDGAVSSLYSLLKSKGLNGQNYIILKKQ